MEHILRERNTIEGNEILYFENAEIEKVKGNSVSFASIGTLSILYFKHYDRFVLMLNDWRYPLLRRLPVIGEKIDSTTRSYILPASNGFSYRLNLGHIPSLHALGNFERILVASSNFSYRGEESPFRRSEMSPEHHRLFRHEKKVTGLRETIKETIKEGVEETKVHSETIKTGTIGLLSRKKALNLKELKNKNYRKRAHATFKKGFFKAGMKMTDEFVKERTHNTNLIQDKVLVELKAGYQLPRMYINQIELEDKILDLKELAYKGNVHLSGFQGEEKREKRRGKGKGNSPHGNNEGFIEGLKQGLREIKDTFSEMLRGPYNEEPFAEERLIERLERPRHVTHQAEDSLVANFEAKRPRHLTHQAEDPLVANFETIQHYQA